MRVCKKRENLNRSLYYDVKINTGVTDMALNLLSTHKNERTLTPVYNRPILRAREKREIRHKRISLFTKFYRADI